MKYKRNNKMINKYKAPEINCPTCGEEMKINNQDNTENSKSVKLEYACKECKNKGIVVLTESAKYDLFIKNEKGELLLFDSDEAEEE